MRVFLHKNVEKVGMAGEIVKVEDGFARNFLIPRKLGSEVTSINESFFKKQIKIVEHRKEVIATQTSMLAERIKHTKVTIKRKMHDDGKLYGAISACEVVEMLAQQGISISKSQVEFEKSIKSKGTFEVTIKLTSRLKPALKVTVIPELQ
jgi:large subunit ribosomal protein L9